MKLNDIVETTQKNVGSYHLIFTIPIDEGFDEEDEGKFVHAVSMSNKPTYNDIKRIYDVLYNDLEMGLPPELVEKLDFKLISPEEDPEEVKEFEEWLANVDIDSSGEVKLPHRES